MSDFKLGEHEGKINQLVTDMTEVRLSVRRIEDALAEKRGERRVGLWLVGAVGAVVSAIVSVVLSKLHL